MPELKSIEIENECFKNVSELKLIGMKMLKKVLIGENCFTKKKSENDKNVYGLYVKNCESLRELKIGNHSFEEKGYEVTYPDGYKSWSPKDVADAAYYPLSENNDGTKILKEDVENFITDVDVTTIGEKTTIVNAHTRSGFDTVRHSSCVDPKNYSEELGKQYAMEEVVNDLWAHLGFVLQWAKYGINVKPKENE